MIVSVKGFVRSVVFSLLASALVGAQIASADIGYSQGFEDPAWTPGTPDWTSFNGGSIQRVASGGGVAGVTSAEGNAHAEIYDLQVGSDVFGNPSLGAAGPYTQFGGYSSTFGNGFTASLAIYLDPNWATGSGFDYSVAVNDQGGVHLRDFMFHVGVVGGSLLVNGSNNTDRSLNDGKLTSGSNYTVADAGWYTFEQSFYDNGGNLAVDLNLKDNLGTTVYTKTLTTSDDIAATVGGNRYGYFTYNNIEGLAIDSSQLLGNVVPEPSTFALVCCGITGFVARKRLKRRA